MTCVDVNLMQSAVGLGVNTACSHKRERALDLGSNLLVALAFCARCHKLLVPSVHSVEICKAALGEGTQQVERARRLVIGLN